MPKPKVDSERIFNFGGFSAGVFRDLNDKYGIIVATVYERQMDYMVLNHQY